MTVIDGSFGEGGGQILRTSIALSAITGKPIKVVNIRAKRPQPGLKRQHLTAIKAAATICGAEVSGLSVGSTQIEFVPKGIRGGTYRFDIGTAGSVTLVLQTLLPIMAYAPRSIEVELVGGTDVPWSPPIDYITSVMLPILSKLGYMPRVELIRRGHYPKGGGIVRVSVEEPPNTLKPLNLVKRGEVVEIRGRSHCVRLPKHVAERQARAAERRLKELGLSAPIRIDLEWYEPGRDPHLGPGSGIVLWAVTEHSRLGGDALGARGKRAEVVGTEAADKLAADLRTGKALDRHMGDNIIPYIGLARGISRVGGALLTLHAYTNLKLVEKILEVEVKLEGKLNEPFNLTVRGSGT